ncbi:2,3-diketo-L-gulonate TRAP transporter small permease protein YiaM [Prosthecochloris sp. CIB 2401]|uniref:TRAP transporter small permease subunit n=2 Tax=Prosthecochloris TaxID=1101 RepID=A0A5C4S118_PROVB|nr:TRAP transporter small permease subunit [Prosthecochloris vibrioformis]ANT64210.1 2,3-diketo-L-gulonate TRAP transporter small permease protein YiaM [Prosthecochloris sp. CIB 2401]TNJ36757.1 TRAP transporter small permease subunit [Prosthecochloris vibrioformis]
MLMQVLSRYILFVDGLTRRIGSAVSWLTLLLVLVIVYDVFTRYVLSSSSVAVQELEWHLFALIFLLGAAVTLQEDKHVRVDVLYSRFSPRRQALVNLVGGLVFLLPFCIVLVISSWPFVYNSFIIMESSPDPGGLPFRYFLKGAIPVGFAMLLLQGSAGMGRSLLVLLGKPLPKEAQP